MGLPDERFKCFDREAFDVINDATDSKLRVIEKEGKIDVCTAIKEIREDSIFHCKNDGIL